MLIVFIIAGAVALAASTTMAVIASGGIYSPSAPGLLGMFAVLLVGAAAVGHAFSRKLYALGIVIGFGMIAGDVAALVQTAQRTAANREAMRAPIADIATKRQAAEKALETAKAAKPEPADQSRLGAALDAKRIADAAVVTKSAEKHCVATCKSLLQSAVDAAQREVDAALAAITEHDLKQRQKIEDGIATAERALASIEPPQSSTPLSDSTGIPEWLFDVTEAVALAFSLNIPASALIALGVKLLTSGIREPERTAQSSSRKTGTPATSLVPVLAKRRSATSGTRRASTEAAQFAAAYLVPASNISLSAADLRHVYEEWCRSERMEPLPIDIIAPALGRLFRRAGIEMREGRVLGVEVAQSVANPTTRKLAS